MVEDKGKEVMLVAFGAEAVRAALYDDNDVELTLAGYERQVIGWTYDGGTTILTADFLGEGDTVANFEINPDPTVTISYVRYLNEAGDLCATHELLEDEETFNNPGTFDILFASLELL